jgi:hypothetical protein
MLSIPYPLEIYGLNITHPTTSKVLLNNRYESTPTEFYFERIYIKQLNMNHKKPYISFRLIVYTILIIFVILISCFCFFFNNLNTVSPVARSYYDQLKEKLAAKGYSVNTIVICAKRPYWINKLLVKYNYAAPKSRHLKGDAIDLLVLDINKDGTADATDIDIVYSILDKEIIRNKGGIGTYKMARFILNRQMIHFDARGVGKRWAY